MPALDGMITRTACFACIESINLNCNIELICVQVTELNFPGGLEYAAVQFESSPPKSLSKSEMLSPSVKSISGVKERITVVGAPALAG
jgi:hypothetical protein